MASTFTDFDSTQQHRLKAAITEAKSLTMTAVNSLLYTLDGRPSVRTATFLAWAFALPPGDPQIWDKIEPIKTTFGVFSSRVDRVAFVHDAKPASKTEIDFDAYVVTPSPTDKIFVRNSFLNKHDPRERALTLIHEMVHLIHTQFGEDHPGGVVISFDASSLGVPYDKAIKNPYCYQAYADWISDPKQKAA